MKFAVVEYTSKTGTIWKHTPERPNYLADPQQELDPTSFGCYVSALAGEHIPMTFLIQPTIAKRIYRKFIGRWPQYDISYLKQFDVLMIVHQIDNGYEVTALTKRVRQELPHIKILGVPTQPYGILVDYWKKHPAGLTDIQTFAHTCHLFITIVKATKQDWEKLLGVSVAYVPQPYPVEFASQYFTSLAKKRQIIYVAGVPERDDIPKGLSVAKLLQQQQPDYTIDYNIPFQPWREHLEYLARVALVINTDYTFTRGRVQVDCAAVGTPSIGANSDGQTDLFPNLAIEQGQRLLNDRDFYTQVVNTARTRLQEYTYEKSAKRIENLVARL